MLWKRTRRTINLKDEIGDSVRTESDSGAPDLFEDGKVLMVDQLWLWILDQRTVVTFFANQEATTSEDKLYEQANLHNSIYNELNGDLARRFETAGDLAALIVQHAVTVLLDRTLHHDLQVLRIFEESISILVRMISRASEQLTDQESDRVSDQVIQAVPKSRIYRKPCSTQQNGGWKNNDKCGA